MGNLSLWTKLFFLMISMMVDVSMIESLSLPSIFLVFVCNVCLAFSFFFLFHGLESTWWCFFLFSDLFFGFAGVWSESQSV